MTMINVSCQLLLQTECWIISRRNEIWINCKRTELHFQK